MPNAKLSRAVVVAVALSLLWTAAGSSGQTTRDPGGDPALKRTRKTVRMLDDIYKGSIVLITTHYVNDEEDLPAGTAFKKLFESVKDKGWHEVRLLDATGEPYNDENVPIDEFEIRAVEHLKAGKPYYDEVIEVDKQRYLRAATPIPVVVEKCTMCHDNYADVEKGQPIGALGYTLPIE